MKKTLLEIYALITCLFSLFCFVITLGIILWNFIAFIAPEFTISTDQYRCYQSDQAYTDCYADQNQYTREKNPEIFPTGQVLTKARQTAYKSAINTEQRGALQGIAREFIILIISAFVFFFHWRIANRSRRTEID